MLRILLGAAGLLLSIAFDGAVSQAHANAQVTCSTRDFNDQPICSSIACAPTVQEAQRLCKADCPRARIDSIDPESSCHPTGGPPPDVSEGRVVLCPGPPPEGTQLRYLAEREFPILSEHRLFVDVPDPGPGQTTNIYCQISNNHGVGYCDRRPGANGRCYIQVYAQFEMRGYGMIRRVGSQFQAEQAFVNKDRHTGMMVRLAVATTQPIRVAPPTPPAKNGDSFPAYLWFSIGGLAVVVAGAATWLVRRRHR